MKPKFLACIGTVVKPPQTTNDPLFTNICRIDAGRKGESLEKERVGLTLRMYSDLNRNWAPSIIQHLLLRILQSKQ